MRFKITLDRPQSAEKPVSLHPLSFKEAVRCLAQVEKSANPRRRGRAAAERSEAGRRRRLERD
ncbi:MAG: hypothetical protein QNI94_09990 [Kiloniellales bacterium]|nr:hypothetical protein [Kiloniellales bacterium]